MKNSELGEWQLCPKCHGQGTVSKPPHVAGDVNQWSSSSTSFLCDVCEGAKILARPILNNGRYLKPGCIGGYVLEDNNITKEDVEKIKEAFSKQPGTFVENCEDVMLKKVQADLDYWFGVTHYDWMYRSTGDEKYLKEKEEFIKKHGR